VWAVVGLGNPGREYVGTRHNVGFALVQRMAREHKAELRGRKFRARSVEIERGGERILLLLPQTYMNLSGRAVRELMKGRNIPAAGILIVMDDLDIPLGEIRIRKTGTAGTHKGMQSIVRETGTTGFPRIRIGIGPLPPGSDAADFVLTPFPRSDQGLLDAAMDKAREALLLVLDGRIDEAMNDFNRKVPS
jgi:PTH1 family peptidyl-tRNA hydrolase